MSVRPPSRRRFIAIVPFGGVALLAACSKAPESQAPAVPAAPSPAPAPEPAPAAAPTPAPASAPETAPAPAPAASATGSLPMVDEKDAQAVALGYVSDATRADKAKYPKFVEGSHCGNCAVYQGKAGDSSGPCPLYAGKAVSAQGWCSAWAKKA